MPSAVENMDTYANSRKLCRNSDNNYNYNNVNI